MAKEDVANSPKERMVAQFCRVNELLSYMSIVSMHIVFFFLNLNRTKLQRQQGILTATASELTQKYL